MHAQLIILHSMTEQAKCLFFLKKKLVFRGRIISIDIFKGEDFQPGCLYLVKFACLV